VTLEFSRRLYGEHALRAGIKHFAGFARFRLQRGPKAFKLTLSGYDSGHSRSLPGEFCNFVLLAGKDGA